MKFQFKSAFKTSSWYNIDNIKVLTVELMNRQNPTKIYFLKSLCAANLKRPRSQLLPHDGTYTNTNDWLCLTPRLTPRTLQTHHIEALYEVITHALTAAYRIHTCSSQASMSNMDNSGDENWDKISVHGVSEGFSDTFAANFMKLYNGVSPLAQHLWRKFGPLIYGSNPSVSRKVTPHFKLLKSESCAFALDFDGVGQYFIFAS